MKPKVDWWEVLDLFCWGLETLGRPSIARALRGYDDYQYGHLDTRFWRHLESKQWIVRRGKGAETKFTITPKGKEQCAQPNPHESWDLPWNRRWWIVTFDVPEVRSKDRVALWRELRILRFGLLQRSVWVWPRPIEEILRNVIHATGIPECFAGFECTNVFLCTHEEIVRTAWDFDRIRQSQQDYLNRAKQLTANLRSARTLAQLARAAKSERLAYREAMEHDPWLPRVLWPKGYLGAKVADRHGEARAELSRRFARLLPQEM